MKRIRLIKKLNISKVAMFSLSLYFNILDTFLFRKELVNSKVRYLKKSYITKKNIEKLRHYHV